MAARLGPVTAARATKHAQVGAVGDDGPGGRTPSRVVVLKKISVKQGPS